MRGRREGTSHWVLEAPSEAFHRLKQLRKIPINLAMYRMKEFLHIKRRSACQAYGHTTNSKECKFITPFYGCCGLRHTRNCKKYELYYINCAESNRLRGTNYKIWHRPVNNHCPCYNKHLTAYRKQGTIISMDNTIFENTHFLYNTATASAHEPLKILQINLARAKAATNQLL
ncbi:hypothetical protein AVEN_191133-1 [Araneus ventricosus]|uniref:Uncharacterized protein n=1 Tax=Araneus ventricosus TaxID=182803 RepID=A0A4Y2AX94_ARAVE|nr:hypothetical protein AVEN_191133-1 [Araneus ventricosus]